MICNIYVYLYQGDPTRSDCMIDPGVVFLLPPVGVEVYSHGLVSMKCSYPTESIGISSPLLYIKLTVLMKEGSMFSCF